MDITVAEFLEFIDDKYKDKLLTIKSNKHNILKTDVPRKLACVVPQEVLDSRVLLVENFSIMLVYC